VPEFWRANALGELRFEIFRRGEAAYEPTAVGDGWYRSAVFGRDFRMTTEPEEDGRPRYTLENRPVS
jgi:hypothetical protein